MIRHRFTPFLFALLLILIIQVQIPVGVAQTTEAAAGPESEITQITGNLYRFVHKHRAGVFLVTELGIIVGDPPGDAAASWLKTELASRFNRTVKYVFFSRLPTERDSGADIFSRNGAVVIAHQNAPENSEISGSVPIVTFSDQLTLRLGSARVTLTHPGKSLGEDLIIAHFPAEKAVYAGDLVAVEQLPQADLAVGHYPDWFMAIDRMNRLNYVYLIPSIGKIGIRNDAIDHGYFLRVLHNRVRKAIEEGIVEEELLQTLKLDRYRRWENYTARLPANITGMYRALAQ